ncbi:GGDEF domain-containing protein [Solidesulfovibrio sp.]|uniref:sensor domain-containing diguanylate cyclase n=1 Tax=Solidesulfovibrio sp. TaxID=2910990 RepID=UPI0026032D7B|nr:GGDEF domain-containing protein [Solidesulfovibrio sp.]
MTHPGRPRIAFRSWLLLLAALAVVPMALFSGATLVGVIDNQREIESVTLKRRALAIASLVGRHLAAQASMLAAVAQSDAGRRDDLEALYAHAVRLVAHEGGSFAISLVDDEGAILFNTRRPFGERLPDTSDPVSARRVIETGRPLVSGPFMGTISHARLVSLGVPVIVGEKPRYCLRALTPVVELYALLGQQHLPDDWSVAVLDGDVVVAAYDPGALLGDGLSDEPVPESNQARPEDNGATLARSAAHTVVSARAGVGDWGWTVAVGVPERAFTKPLRRMLVRFGLGGVLCLATGLAAAWWLARRLERDVCALTEASADIIQGERPLDEGVIIREVGQVRACLLAARDREEQALTDPLTGLPMRGLFWELARKLEEAAKADGNLEFAVMFIDLDGFKQVNDVHGHDEGDRALSRTAQVLRESVRDTDVVGRLGGDEFVVCLTAPRGQLRAAASSMAGRIVAGVGELGFGLGCSIGVSLCRDLAPDLKHALDMADAAMYEAKRLGKNRYVMREDACNDTPA